MSLLMEALRKAEHKKQAAVVDSPPEPVDPETRPEEQLLSQPQPSMQKAEDADIGLKLSTYETLKIEGENQDGTLESAEEDTNDTLDVWGIEEEATKISLVEDPASFDLQPEVHIDFGAVPDPVFEFPAEETVQALDMPEFIHELQPASDIPAVSVIATTGASMAASRQAAQAVFVAKNKHQRLTRNRRLLLVGMVAVFMMLGTAGYLFFFHQTTMMNFTKSIVPVKTVAPPAEPVNVPQKAAEVEPSSPTAPVLTDAGKTQAVSDGAVGSSEQKSVGDQRSPPVQAVISLSQTAPGLPQVLDAVPQAKILPVASSLPIPAPTTVPTSRQDLPAAPQLEPKPLPLPEYQALSQSAISITHHESRPQIDPLSTEAYAAYQKGDFAQSRRNYQKILQANPEHRGAMLGLAALAMHSKEVDLARDLYLRLLERDPSDPLAKVGLLAIMPKGNPASTESELKLLLEVHPNIAPLSFSLGNLYAAGQRWNEAQQAYFNALQAAGKAASRPEAVSPDYPFNLAVSLEHLNQFSLAVRYYRQALKLAAQHPAGFDREALRQRLDNLNQIETQ